KATRRCCSRWRGSVTAIRCIRSAPGCARWSTAWRWRCTARRGPSTARSAPRCARASATCRSTAARCCCCCSAGGSSSAWPRWRRARTRSRSPTSSPRASAARSRWPRWVQRSRWSPRRRSGLRMAKVAQSQNTVSIADFIASRFGRSQPLAALVATIALIAAVPYLALQYKAVAISVVVLAGQDPNGPALGDPGLYVAALMALFAILFGTRQVDATEHRPGMMLAVALESLVKLVALVAVGLFASSWLGARDIDYVAATRALIDVAPPVGFAAQCLLAFAAIFCLPRQFHVAIVECGNVADIRRARWMFGAYLVIVTLMVVPIASAGMVLFGNASDVAPDSFVLALPLAEKRDTLALLAYVGGFSAATGMVIVASVALATMVSNDLVMPLLLRRG